MDRLDKYDAILIEARNVFEEDSTKNECDWRILRLLPVIEKLTICTKKIEDLAPMRTDNQTKVLIKNQFLKILNYSAIFLIQCKNEPVTTKSDMCLPKALVHYDNILKMSRNQIPQNSIKLGRPLNEISLDTWIDSIHVLTEDIKKNLKIKKAKGKAQYSVIQVLNTAAFAIESITT